MIVIIKNKRVFQVFLVVVLALICVTPLKSQSHTLPQLFNGESTLKNQYGITSHITWHGFEYDDYKHNVDLIKQSGNNIIRTDFSAKNLGWDIGKADYTIWDNVYKEATTVGLQLLPMIYCDPKSITKGSNGTLKDYVETCVSRYGNHVAGWEIGNEFDLVNAEDGSRPPREYLAILKETYNAIKATNKNNKVLIGAIGSIENHYLKDLLSAKASDFFDILSIHHYCSHGVPESIIHFYYKLDSLLSHYHFEKPVWLTETGYKSYQGPADQDIFYTEILPSIYQRLGIDISKYSMGLLYDNRISKSNRNQDNRNIYSGFKSSHLVGLEELKNLSVKKCPVLMILFKEFFPKGYFADLKSYVQRGGTVVFPEGGAALFNELDLETNDFRPVGKKYYKPLHINYMFEWEAEAKEKGVKRINSINTVVGKEIKYAWHNDDYLNPQYLMDDNLDEGDELIPLVYGTDVKYTGIVAACYRLNSDLKGNVIIQTRQNHSQCVSERLQASRIPRLLLISYAMGIDKVLPYCLRDREEDRGYGLVKVNNQKKTSFKSLETLTRFLPSGSSRPIIETKDNQYIASWRMPDGNKVFCVWSSLIGQGNTINVKGQARYYDESGQRILKKDFLPTPNVTYIIGAKSVVFI